MPLQPPQKGHRVDPDGPRLTTLPPLSQISLRLGLSRGLVGVLSLYVRVDGGDLTR